MKTMKFQPGTFLEMDDLAGGRKVVVVGRDGSTYWDMLEADRVTPIVIHPSQNAENLGTMADFVQKHGLQEHVEGLVLYLRNQGLDPEGNPLFVMRALWEMARRSGEQAVSDTGLEQALHAAKAQEVLAIKIHDRAEQYCGQQ